MSLWLIDRGVYFVRVPERARRSRSGTASDAVKQSLLAVVGTGIASEPEAELAEPAQPALTLVVDGPSLEVCASATALFVFPANPSPTQFILKDKTLSINFLVIGRECRSVVCCRVSPKQKALVVELAVIAFYYTGFFFCTF